MSDQVAQNQIVVDKTQLKTPCQEVSMEDGLRIADELSAALTASKIPGCGLAANQIGIDAKVFIIRIPKWDLQGFEYTVETSFINPKISDLQEPVKVLNEGCLSFPNQRCQTLRYRRCKIVDLLQPEGRLLEGLPAIACQHEADHLEGLVMFDRLFEELKPNQECLCKSGKNFKQCCRPKVKEF